MTKKVVIISFGKILPIIIGALITAYGLESTLTPDNISGRGVTGISVVGSTLFGLPLGISIGIINLPFIRLGYKQIRRKFAILSIIGILSLSIFTSIMHHVPTIIEDGSLLIAVVDGVVIGLGMDLALKNGGALDGIDMLAVLLSRKLFFGAGDLILFFNTFVFILVSTVFGFKGAILSTLTYLITSEVIHIIEEGPSDSKTFKIITKDYDTMNKEIKERLGGHCTFTRVTIDGENDSFVEISCVIGRLEEQKPKEIMNDVDPDASIATYGTTEVKAGNMEKSDIY